MSEIDAHSEVMLHDHDSNSHHGAGFEVQWPSLDDLDKATIFREVEDDFRLCGIAGGVLPYYKFFAQLEDIGINGPFEDGGQLVKTLAKRSRINWEENQRYFCLADFYEKPLAPALNKVPIYADTF